MQAPEILDQTTTPDGEAMQLLKHAGDFIVRVGRNTLMASTEHHSEQHMAEIACEGIGDKTHARVLVGGLGMGYTLRAVLSRLSATATVVVSELMPAIVEWNRGVLGPLAEHPLDDPRVTVDVGDIQAHLLTRPQHYDAIVLDIDNGPDPLTASTNKALYRGRGLARIRDTLKRDGVLVVWSSFASPAFVESLHRAGMKPEAVRSHARGDKGPRHTLYVGRK